jgi:biopolymer transport protein ExbD
MRVIATLLFICIIAVTGCRRQSEPHFDKIAKVKVTKTGYIYLDGKAVSLDQLKQEFAGLKAAKGAVLYFREDPQGEPHPNAMAVIKAITDVKLPVQLVEKDFQ